MVNQKKNYFRSDGRGQGCPTFLFNGPHCKLKYLTGSQTTRIAQYNGKITWIAIRTGFSLKNTSLVLQETKDCYCNQSFTQILIKGWGRNWGPGEQPPAAKRIFCDFHTKTTNFCTLSFRKRTYRYLQASAITIDNMECKNKSAEVGIPQFKALVAQLPHLRKLRSALTNYF